MDFHFLIRNGIVGFIFLSAIICSVAVVDGTLAEQMVRAAGKDMAALTTFGVAPVLGMVIQSVFIMIATLYAKCCERLGKCDPEHGLFKDAARLIVSDAVKEELGRAKTAGAAPPTNSVPSEASPAGVREVAMKNLRHPHIEPDQIFVAVYHTRAPIHLIEWARRRRTYYYLGATGTLALLLGCLLGPVLVLCVRGVGETLALLDQLTRDVEDNIWQFSVGIVGAAAFLDAIRWLSRRMWRDANRMELAWALIETDQRARQRLFKGEVLPDV